MIGMEWASCSASPDAFIMKVVRGTLLEPLTTPQDHTKVIGGSFVWSYPDVSDEVWKHKVSMAMLRSPLVANWKSPPFADVQLVLSRVPPFALACRMR